MEELSILELASKGGWIMIVLAVPKSIANSWTKLKNPISSLNSKL